MTEDVRSSASRPFMQAVNSMRLLVVRAKPPDSSLRLPPSSTTTPYPPGTRVPAAPSVGVDDHVRCRLCCPMMRKAIRDRLRSAGRLFLRDRFFGERNNSLLFARCLRGRFVEPRLRFSAGREPFVHSAGKPLYLRLRAKSAEPLVVYSRLAGLCGLRMIYS